MAKWSSRWVIILSICFFLIFLTVQSFLIHIMRFLNTGSDVFFPARVKNDTASFSSRSSYNPPSSTGCWKQEGEGPPSSDCFPTYKQRLFTEELWLLWSLGRKKETKKGPPTQEVTDRHGCTVPECSKHCSTFERKLKARHAKRRSVYCGWRLCGHRCAGMKRFSATFIALKDCSLVVIYFFTAGSSLPLFWTGSRHQAENKDKREQTGELGWNGWAGTSTVRYI